MSHAVSSFCAVICKSFIVVVAVTNILALGIKKDASLRLQAKPSHVSSSFINGKTTSLTYGNISSALICVQ